MELYIEPAPPKLPYTVAVVSLAEAMECIKGHSTPANRGVWFKFVLYRGGEHVFTLAGLTETLAELVK